MQNLQEVYVKLQEKKKAKKELAKMFQDELKNNGEYQELLEEMKTLRERKKSIENTARASAFGTALQMEELDTDIKNSNEMLTDLALTMYLSRQTVEIVDEYNARLVPQFAVKFKKDEMSAATEPVAEKAVEPTKAEAPAPAMEEVREPVPA